MMSKDTGGSAFPLFAATGYTGMTLRDYFAAKAMQAIAQKYSHEGDVSRNAYKIADAMLKVRGL
jgi:hypothetical protein